MTILLAPEHFHTIGSIDSFQWAPSRYENSFKYDILYYIPTHIKDSERVASLIFTHGGGTTTLDRVGSLKYVNVYIPDLKRIANDLGIIVVLPSSNGLNWGGHTRGLLKELVRLMRKELNLDSNRIGVSGHSMGGMGITRNYIWTADEFAFYLPMSAGMDVNKQNEQQLNKVFNVPYVHLQGINDHFTIFINWCQEQLKRTKNLAVLYDTPSKLEIIYYNGSHNYNFELFKSTLNRLITTSPRNLYQKTLYGSIHTIKSKNVENNITYDYDSVSRYFWIELTNTDLTNPERIDFKASVVGNNIEIEMPVMPVQSNGLKIYIHSLLVDLNKTVEVLINGKVATRRVAKAGVLRNMDANDPGFNFEDTINITLCKRKLYATEKLQPHTELK
jgi:hypothetical protein